MKYITNNNNDTQNNTRWKPKFVRSTSIVVFTLMFYLPFEYDQIRILEHELKDNIVLLARYCLIPA